MEYQHSTHKTCVKAAVISLGIGLSGPASAVTLLAVDFGDTGVLQPGFTANSTGSGTISGASGVSANLVTTTTNPNIVIVNRTAASATSTGSEATIANGTEIGPINQDFLFTSNPGSNVTVAFSGLTNGVEYTFESWHADNTVAVSTNIDQLIEFSTDGGANFSTIGTIAASTNFSAPRVSDVRTYNTGEDWVYRITEANGFDQLRINAFALTVVPEPSSIALLSLSGLGLFRKKRR